MSIGSCPGNCCEAFNLPYSIDKIQDRITEYSSDEERFIADMLIPLGEHIKNPIHAIEGEDETAEALLAAKAPIGYYYTCRHFDKESRLCTVYEKRPKMCRSYPNRGEPCAFVGCDFQITENCQHNRIKADCTLCIAFDGEGLTEAQNRLVCTAASLLVGES